MHDLIEQLDAVASGSQKLNAEIAAACRMIPVNSPYWLRQWEGPLAAVDGRIHNLHKDGTHGVNWTPDPFTTSIDAALTLVPKEWFLDGLREVRTRIIYAGEQHKPTGLCQANLQHIGGGRLTSGEGASFALALCIAALRVRQGSAT